MQGPRVGTLVRRVCPRRSQPQTAESGHKVEPQYAAAVGCQRSFARAQVALRARAPRMPALREGVCCVFAQCLIGRNPERRSKTTAPRRPNALCGRRRGDLQRGLSRAPVHGPACDARRARGRSNSWRVPLWTRSRLEEFLETSPASAVLSAAGTKVPLAGPSARIRKKTARSTRTIDKLHGQRKAKVAAVRPAPCYRRANRWAPAAPRAESKACRRVPSTFRQHPSRCA
jgi:hypothetical protein